MLRAYMLDLKGSWDEHLPLVGFAYKNSYRSSIQMSPFEALCGQKCNSRIYSDDVGEGIVGSRDYSEF